MNWQPIETAPKDATAVLLTRLKWPGGEITECNGWNTYVAAWWSDDENNDPGKGRWVIYMDWVCEPRCPIEPSHWMPLPLPPTE